jgi:hypothetical protein
MNAGQKFVKFFTSYCAQQVHWLLSKFKTENTIGLDVFFALSCYTTSNINVVLVLAADLKPIAPGCYAVDRTRREFVAGPSVDIVAVRSRYEGNSISKLQIQVASYVFELSAGNSHR